jgi:phage-related minor tail protein
VLLQQGGQIRDQFGSVGAALRGIASFITPFTVGVGAAAAAVGALAMAFVRGEAESVAFNRALAVTNNYAGQTADRFNAAAERVQASANVTAAAARELLQAVVSSGRYGPSSVEAVAGAMANLQRVTGLTTKDIQQQFAGLSKSAGDWAAEMNRSYNFIDVAQYRYIRRLEEAGDKEGAMREAAKLLENALKTREQNLGTLERAWKKVSDAASGAWQSMLNIGREDTVGEQIAVLERRLKNVDDLRRAAEARGQKVGAESPELQAARAQLEALKETQRLQSRAADAAAARAAANQKAIEDERQAEEERKRNTGQRISEFEQIKRQLEDQAIAVRDLGVADTLRAQFAAGRYREVSKEQQEVLLKLAAELDYKKFVAEADDAAAKRADDIARKRQQAAEAEARQMDAARQRWIDVIDPIDKYRRQLVEIRALVAAGKLTPEQGLVAEFNVQEQISDQLDGLKSKGKDTFKELTDAVNGWGRQATDTFLDFVFTGKASFSDLVSSILRDLARMMLQKNVTTPLFNALQGVNWSSLFGFADGGVMTAGGPLPLRTYSKGGIANSPQLALYGEGKMPEAYVPLPDGRTIPVTIQGGRGGGDVYNISVPVTVDGAGQPQASTPDGAGSLGKAIAAAVRSEIINQKRPGGLLAA